MFFNSWNHWFIKDDQRELDQCISGNLTPEQHCYEYLSKTNIPGQKRIKGQEALWLRYIINEFFCLFLITFSIHRTCDLLSDIIIESASSRPLERRWVHVEYLIAFISSVVAGVVSYYICKWLDGVEKNSRSA